MSWIELHDTLPDHPKVLALSEALNIDKDAVVGKLVRLWTWALNNREDGRISTRDAGAVAEIMRYRGKAVKLIQALKSCGWLDSDGDGWIIHDWEERVGMLLERRQHQREYSRRKNELYSNMRLTKAIRARDGDICQYCGKVVNWNDRRGTDGGTYDHIDPCSDNSLENLCVACRSCNSKKKDRTPEEAAMSFIPDSPLWQVYGKSMVNTELDKRQEISAITIPYQVDEEEDDEEEEIKRAHADHISALKSSQERENHFTAVWTLAFGKPPNKTQVGRLVTLSWRMDLELLDMAVTQAALHAAKDPIAYISRIMEDWSNKGIATVDDYLAAKV